MFRFFKKPEALQKSVTIGIVMRSGVVIEADKVIDFEAKSQGNEVTYLRLKQKKNAKVHVHVVTMALNQIDCILEY